MFAKDFGIKDIERFGPVIEGLLLSGKLNEEERLAVERCCHAATDLVFIRHSEVARAFYERMDIISKSTNSIAEWLVQNPAAVPGTVALICGRLHVTSYDAKGSLNLSPVQEL